jgi:hypothetical protein
MSSLLLFIGVYRLEIVTHVGIFDRLVQVDRNNTWSCTVKKRLPVFRPPSGMTITRLFLAGNLLTIPGQEESGN